MKLRLLAATLVLTASTAASAQNAEQRVQAILSSASFRDARTFLESDHERFVRELITLTEIPAPPFKEQKRAAAYLEMLRAAKLADVETDAEGNVMGVRKGTANGPVLAVLAHLDTVFPEGTDVTVKRNGNRVIAPGAGDDTGALATWAKKGKATCAVPSIWCRKASTRTGSRASSRSTAARRAAS
jgi:tripeptide aminopeptidase